MGRIIFCIKEMIYKMATIKIDKNKKNEPVFYLNISNDEIQKYRLLKRALMESTPIKKGKFNYRVPLRYFEVIFRTIPGDFLIIDNNSLDYYLEFSDDYDEIYYYKSEADAVFMRSWRKEGCPDIYKINIYKKTKKISKEIAFKKVNKMIL